MRFETSGITLACWICEDITNARRVTASFATKTINRDKRIFQPNMASTTERKLLDPSELGTKE